MPKKKKLRKPYKKIKGKQLEILETIQTLSPEAQELPLRIINEKMDHISHKHVWDTIHKMVQRGVLIQVPVTLKVNKEWFVTEDTNVSDK